MAVSSLFTNSKMRINARIARSSRQILVVLVLNVHKGSGIAISLGQTIIDEINMVSTLPCSHDIVFRLRDGKECVSNAPLGIFYSPPTDAQFTHLDISMNKMLRM